MRISKIVRSALLTLLFPHCLGVNHLSREAEGSITYGRALVGYVITSFETRGFLSCGHECLSYSSCKSYNYHPTSKERGFCELNDNEGELEADFISLQGSVFAKLTRQEVRHKLLFVKLAILIYFCNCKKLLLKRSAFSHVSTLFIHMYSISL